MSSMRGNGRTDDSKVLTKGRAYTCLLGRDRLLSSIFLHNVCNRPGKKSLPVTHSSHTQDLYKRLLLCLEDLLLYASTILKEIKYLQDGSHNCKGPRR